ncbi:MAG: ASKHA domain-containing protein, partial [Planctomycetota bacterium]|nr:ASKHA domain-containing protein [Planctomycetota bacterium]
MPKIRFLPDGVTVEVPEGETVLEAAGRAGIILNSACGGAGTCGKCAVRLVEGIAPPDEASTRGLGAEEIEKGYRLACRVRVAGDAAFLVPPGSRFYRQQVLMDGVSPSAEVRRPNVRQYFLELPPASLDDQRSDMDRLADALRGKVPSVEAGLEEMRELTGAMHADSFRVTATLVGNAIARVQPGDARGSCLGLAFDIGTTTVVGYLADIATGRDLGRAARSNPQAVFGQDVLSRARHAAQSPDGLWDLQERIVSCLQDLGEDLAGKAGVGLDDIYEIVTAGNTIMTHLFLGLNPRHIAQVPFTPVIRRGCSVLAADVGLRYSGRARLFTMPCVAGYVGGDITAGMVAVRLDRREKLTLFIDIGTNGEIVLAGGGELLACAAPAGPAFEGARISCGMRAELGAIDRVRIEGGDIRISTIGGYPPRGICGTGLIDAVRCLLDLGVVDSAGRLEKPAGLPPKVAGRIREGGGGLEIVLVPRDATEDRRRDIVITQRDVRELQLAKGAIRSGVETALAIWGASVDALDRVLLAG